MRRPCSQAIGRLMEFVSLCCSDAAGDFREEYNLANWIDKHYLPLCESIMAITIPKGLFEHRYRQFRIAWISVCSQALCSATASNSPWRKQRCGIGWHAVLVGLGWLLEPRVSRD